MTKGKGKMPGASGLSKHIKRKEHHERSQPAHRQHLGQLEKQKDHALRSKKRRAKVQRLTQIKRAAAQRNPDEFHIGMTKAIMDVASGKMKRRRVRQDKTERAAELKKTIDHNLRNVQYLAFKAQADQIRAKDILQEDASAAITATAPKSKHTVFVETEEDFRRFNPQAYFDATPEMLRQHPAVRGTISVLQNTVLPDDVLLNGHHMLSASQKRKLRQTVQERLRKSGATTPEEKQAVLDRLKTKEEMKKYRFTDLVDEARQHAQASEGVGSDAGVEEAANDVEAILKLKRAKEDEEALSTARRMREATQRVERSKSLIAIAKTLRRQNEGITKQIRQRRDSRFKPNAQRRAR